MIKVSRTLNCALDKKYVKLHQFYINCWCMSEWAKSGSLTHASADALKVVYDFSLFLPFIMFEV